MLEYWGRKFLKKKKVIALIAIIIIAIFIPYTYFFSGELYITAITLESSERETFYEEKGYGVYADVYENGKKIVCT
jgi:hypothetical protein